MKHTIKLYRLVLSLSVLGAFVFSLTGCHWISSTLQSVSSNSTTILPSCDATTTSSYGGGSGTPSDPYLICSTAQWLKLGATSSDWSKSFKLESNVDLGLVPSGTFTPIGDATTPFSGSLNGAGYSIQNLTVSSTLDLGLFGVTSNATFSNLTLKSFSLTQTGASKVTAALVAQSLTTLTLSNVNVESLTITGPAAAISGMGGLVGLGNTVNVSTSSLTNLTFTGAGTGNRGGVVGRINAASTLSNVNISNLSMTSAGGNIGGLVGQFSPAASNESLAITGARTASVTLTTSASGTGNAGGVVGIFTSFCGANCVVSLSNSVIGVSVPFLFGTYSFLYAGGMIGYLNDLGGGQSSSTSTSALTVDIGSLQGSGGIIGMNSSSSIVDKTRVLGVQVYAHTSGSGGLFGQVGANATITDSAVQVATVGIHGTQQNVGGILASIGGALTVQRTMTSASVTGNTGNTNRGCFVGSVIGALTSADNFYDNQTCTLGKGRQSGAMAGVSPDTTLNLQTSTTYTLANWLTSVWAFPASSYPKLLWE